MQKDPCRRFTLGFTIENTRMSFWFSDRSQILVSEPFNFITVSVTLRLKQSAILTSHAESRTIHTLLPRSDVRRAA